MRMGDTWIVDGCSIKSIHTRGTMYDNDCALAIVVDDDGCGERQMIIPMSTVIQMVNEFNFKAIMKRKYAHLVEAKLKQEQPY